MIHEKKFILLSKAHKVWPAAQFLGKLLVEAVASTEKSLLQLFRVYKQRCIYIRLIGGGVVVVKLFLSWENLH